MVSDWRPLEEVIEDILDRRGVTPLKLGGDFTNAGHRVISAKVVKNGRVDLAADEARFVDEAIYKKWMKTPLRADDVVMTSEAPLGELAYLDRDVNWVLGQRLFAIRPRAGVLSGRFLYYVLATPKVRDSLIARSSGTTVIGIRQAELRKIEIPVPPFEEQSAIAETLGALDDRIDNLRQTNTTLQAIAAALFKSRFVDFDGVSPEDMQESELGLIPQGWRAFTFGEIATLGKGSVNPATQPHTVFQHYSLPAFDAGQMPIAEAGEAIKSNKTPVPPSAVLVSKLNPHIPRIWFVGGAGENAVCSTEFLVWTPKSGIGSAFVYFVATSLEFNSSMRQLVTGTSNSHQRVKPDQLATIRAAIASKESIAAFDKAATPLLKKIEHNRQQAAALTTLRDTLLPRLISGKLRVAA